MLRIYSFNYYVNILIVPLLHFICDNFAVAFIIIPPLYVFTTDIAILIGYVIRGLA